MSKENNAGNKTIDDTIFSLSQDSKVFLEITEDGKVNWFGDQDAAAKTFWEAVSDLRHKYYNPTKEDTLRADRDKWRTAARALAQLANNFVGMQTVATRADMCVDDLFDV